MIEKEKLKKAHSNWLKAQRFTLFGTLKFVDGESINEFIAKRRLAYFFNMLDRKVRNAKEVKKGNRLNRFVYLESGKSRSNLHAHFFIKGSTLKETKDIIIMAHRLWQKVEKANNIDIKLNEDFVGTSGYCVKEMDNIDKEILVLDFTH